MPRRLRLAPLLAVLLAAFALPVVTGTAAACAGIAAERADGWTELRPGGSSTRPLVSYAVVPTAPDTIYATDGVAVWATHDGGCAWKDVLGSAEPAPVGAVARRPVSVAVSFPRDVTVAWIASTVTVAGVPRPEVLVADTATDAFGTALGGVQTGGSATVLPSAGTPVSIVAGSEPDYAYLLVDEAAGRRLYATTDRGLSWQPRGLLSGSSASAFRGLAVDSVTASIVWAWGDSLQRSADGGETFEPVEGVTGPFADVAVAQSPKGSRVEALTTAGRIWRSDDGGVSWSSGAVDRRATSVAAAPVVDVAAVAGPGVVRVLSSVFSSIDMPTSAPGVADVGLARFPTGNVRMALRSGPSLLRLDFSVDEGGGGRVIRPGDSKVRLLPGARTVQLYPRLAPETQVVTLAPGETRTVPYRLELPPTPTPIDVFFLVDTTGSMQGVIDALRLALARIVNDLTLSGIEAHFGVGSFRDYPLNGWGNAGDKPYELYREIGPVDQDLQFALQRLNAGGGGDGPEAQFEALFEAVHDDAGRKSFLDEPEPATEWRPGALHLAVVATDTTSHQGGNGAYPGASYEQLVDALHRAAVRTVGISADDGAKPDLRAHAQDTGSVAPPGGLDCNADGTIDIQEGLPLVCAFATGVASNVPVGTPVPGIIDPNGARGLSGAIVAMLRAQHDPATVRLESSAPGVATVLGGVHPGVDVKVPNTVTDRVRFTCGPRLYGTTTDVRLPAYVGARLVAEGTARVACGSPAGPVPPPSVAQEPLLTVPQVRPLPVAAVAVPAPAPPAPIHNVNPNTNPNAQVNSNVTTQTGTATEEQQEYQLALVTDAMRNGEDTELAMSALDRPAGPALPGAALPAGAAVLAAAAGAVEARRRSRTRSALAYARPRR